MRKIKKTDKERQREASAMKTTIEGECDRQWSARVSVNA
jgi:hypothetical protein